VLEHPDRHDRVERIEKIAVVLEAELDWQTVGELGGPALLLARDRHSHDAHAVTLRRKDGEAAPSTPDVEDPHPGLESDPSTDQIELRFLRGIEICRSIPPRAAVSHPAIEHRREQVIAEIVVPFPDLERPRAPARIPQPRHHDCQHIPPAPDVPDESRSHDACHELIEALAVPPAVHVCLAESERSVPKHAIEEALVVDLRITRLRAVQLDV